MRKATIFLKKGAIFFLFFSALIIFFGAFMYRSTAKSMRQQIGSQCLGISATVAAMIEQDIDGYMEFSRTLDTQSEYYASAKGKLEEIQIANSGIIQFLYTEKKISDSEIMFILDGDSEESELFAPPGSTTGMTVTRRGAYDTGKPCVGETFTENAFGRLLSAYAPIRDRSGSMIGLVGVDISAAQYDSIMQGEFWMIAVIAGILILMMLVMGGRLVRVYDEKLRSDQSSASKSNFLARMSHEIRTPMNAICGMTELILLEDLSPVVRDHAANIRQASANLLAIINDILDFSKVESGKLEIIEAPYQFSSLIHDVVSVIRMRMAEKPVKLLVFTDSFIPDEMIGDEVRLRQIMINILANAVKFTDKGHVAIHAEGKPGEKGHEIILTIKITDTGIGIKPEDMERLFDDFSQVDQQRNKNIEGTGLGLTISKNLCGLMGGKITVDSVYGQGSSFTVTLPQQCRCYTPIAKVREADTKRVLLYETCGLYAEYTGKTLENLGVRYTTVTTQSALLSGLQTKAYTHVFVTSILYESVKRIIQRLELKSVQMVLLCEYGENNMPMPDAYSIIMPAYAGPVACALNDDANEQQYLKSDARTIRFAAPDARVLIVDDIKTNSSVAMGLLAPFQMIIDCAQSGEEAIDLIKANRYDLVLMDHMMPNMDGIETSEKIRALGEMDPYMRHLPIVALTANAVSGMREVFIQNGMNDYLAKPIEVSKLYAIIEKWIPKEKQLKWVQEAHVQEKPDIEIEGIDVEAGIALVGGTLAHYEHVLETFYLDTIEKKAQIQAAFSAKDLSLFTTHVHAVKGASASIGAISLSEAAKGLELAGRREDMEYIEENFAPFLRQLSTIADAITRALPQIKGNCAECAQEDGRELQGLLLALKAGLAEIDVAAIDGALAGLRSGKWTVSTQNSLMKIDQLILLFEYESAIEIIAGMIG